MSNNSKSGMFSMLFSKWGLISISCCCFLLIGVCLFFLFKKDSKKPSQFNPSSYNPYAMSPLPPMPGQGQGQFQPTPWQGQGQMQPMSWQPMQVQGQMYNQ
jgi:hypothetical protein